MGKFSKARIYWFVSIEYIQSRSIWKEFNHAKLPALKIKNPKHQPPLFSFLRPAVLIILYCVSNLHFGTHYLLTSVCFSNFICMIRFKNTKYLQQIVCMGLVFIFNQNILKAHQLLRESWVLIFIVWTDDAHISTNLNVHLFQIPNTY